MNISRPEGDPATRKRADCEREYERDDVDDDAVDQPGGEPQTHAAGLSALLGGGYPPGSAIRDRAGVETHRLSWGKPLYRSHGQGVRFRRAQIPTTGHWRATQFGSRPAAAALLDLRTGGVGELISARFAGGLRQFRASFGGDFGPFGAPLTCHLREFRPRSRADVGGSARAALGQPVRVRGRLRRTRHPVRARRARVRGHVRRRPATRDPPSRPVGCRRAPRRWRRRPAARR